MPDIAPNEPQGIKERSVVLPAEVRGWLETGPKDSPLMFGTSLQRLDAITKTGELPPHRSEIYWQKALTAEQKNLYYFYPVIDQLQTASPNFSQQYLNNLSGEANHDYEHLEDNARFYAFRRTLVDGFKKDTNFKTDWDVIFEIAKKVCPDLISTDPLLSEDYAEVQAFYGDPDIVSEADTMISLLGEERSTEIVSGLIQRRGFIIYLKPDVLLSDELRPHLGFEDEVEVMITSKDPLKSEIISGLVSLSPPDRNDLHRMMYPGEK